MPRLGMRRGQCFSLDRVRTATSKQTSMMVTSSQLTRPLVGPALIELSGTTVVVPPDYSVQRDRHGNFILNLAAIARS